MASVNICSSELSDILAAMPAEQNIMLVGRHGIGKSEILTNYFSAQGMRVVSLFLGQMSDPGDLIGLPTKNEQTGKTEFMPPYWFPTDGQPVVLFLDELNRARPEVLQTIMDLALNRTLAGRKLPEGSRLISAVNDGEEYQLTDLDPALVSRFNVYNFRPSTEEWLLWATKKKLDARVVGFIQDSPSLLDGDEAAQSDTGLDKTPDRRAWKKVSDCIINVPNLTPIYKKLIAGIVGAPATAKFFAYVSANKSISAKDVLLKFQTVEATLKTYQVHQLSVVNDAIYRFLETKQYKPSEVETVKKNIIAYMDCIADRREALAHFASVFGNGTYPNAIVFFMTQTPDVYARIMEFIQNI